MKKICSKINYAGLAPWVVMILTALLFIKSISFEPLRFMDDYNYVFNNPNIGLSLEQIKTLITEPVLGLWTPLPMLSFLFDYALAGLDPRIYHLQNLIWHLAAIAAVWGLLRELSFSSWSSFFITLIFAIHPQRVESVVWIAERKDVMTAFFFFATLYSYVLARKSGRFFSVGSIIFAFCAMLCKPSGAALPAVIFLLEIYRNRRWDFKIGLKLWPFWALALSYMIAVSVMLKTSLSTITLFDYPAETLLLMLNNYFSYIGKTIVPLELFPLYPYFVVTTFKILMLVLLTITLIVVILFIAIKKTEFFKYDLLPFLLIFAGLLLPASGIFTFSNADFADRYSYIPSFFLLVPIAMWLQKLPLQKIKRLKWGLCGYCCYLFFFSWSYMEFWRNDYAFLQASCETPTPNFRASSCLAWLFFENGLYDQALAVIAKSGHGSLQKEHQRSLITLYQDFFTGIIAYRRNQRETAYQYLSKAADSPYSGAVDAFSYGAFIEMMEALANLELERNNVPKAAHCYLRLAKFCQPVPHLHYYYAGLSSMLLENYKEAATAFQSAIESEPNNPEIRRLLKEATAKSSASD